MGLRRERPAQEIGAGSIGLILRDGSTVSVTLGEAGREPAPEAICCFCGEEVEESDPRHVTVEVHRSVEGKDETQSFSAHDTCLAERMHERVKATGFLPDR